MAVSAREVQLPNVRPYGGQQGQKQAENLISQSTQVDLIKDTDPATYYTKKYGITKQQYEELKPYIDKHPYSARSYKFGDLISNAVTAAMTGRTAYENDWWQEILKDYREGEAAKEANRRQEEREDTAYQRTARDAIAAGLNPWVLMQGGASPMSVNSSHKASTSKENEESENSNSLLKILMLALLAMTKGKSARYLR